MVENEPEVVDGIVQRELDPCHEYKAERERVHEVMRQMDWMVQRSEGQAGVITRHWLEQLQKALQADRPQITEKP